MPAMWQDHPSEDDADLITNVRQHASDDGHESPLGMTDEEIDAQILSEAREVTTP
jgi:hypothetical protein